MRPIDVYAGYPECDLLAIAVDETTTPAEVEAIDCGDSLFKFLVRECCSRPGDPATAVARAERAARDCQEVADYLRQKFQVRDA